MKKLNETMIQAKVKLQKAGETIGEKLYGKLQESSGNFLEEALKYIIGAVIGALFLGGIYILFKNVIIPGLGSKVESIFDFTA